MIPSTETELAKALLELGKLDPDGLDTALREAAAKGDRLEEVLVASGMISEDDLLQGLARAMQVPFRKLADLKPDVKAVQLVQPKIAEHYGIVPLTMEGDVLTIACSDPHDMYMLDELRRLFEVDVEIVLATKSEIEKAYNRLFGIGSAVMQHLSEESEEGGIRENEINLSDNFDIDEMAADATIVKFVNQLIQEAMRDRATDIHVEPMDKELRIRYRIDGMLYEAPIPPAIKRFQAAIISRFKIMADLNIAERRLPQDGKIKIKMGDKEFDLRVATVPTPYGESVAIRILSRTSSLTTLEKLGFSERHKALMRQMIQKPYGIIFVTGPTGSGKSTTLYAALSEINSIDRKIITIEDPIEYRIPGTTQIQVNAAIDLTFARVLRSTLRLDPDVIMVGETRDPETAKITIATAMTGHLVFSTLHTNDAAGAFTRLNDMGVDSFLIASSVEGVVAQRLVRVLCAQCRAKTAIDPGLLRQVNMTKDDPDSVTVWKQMGCEQCRGTGYSGRTALHEVIRVNEAVRRKIVANASASDIKATAVSFGMEPIRFDGWGKIKSGTTTAEEVLRVTMEDEFNQDSGIELSSGSTG